MMNDSQQRFTEHARTALLRSGWTPQRAAASAVAEWQHALTQAGIEIFSEARRILEEFGGLRLLREGTSTQRVPLREFLFFDPTAAPIDGPRLEAMTVALGTRLCPIGALGPVNIPVAVGADRRIFLLAEPARLVGGNIEAAIDALATGKEFTVPFTPEGAQYGQGASRSGSPDVFVVYQCDEGSTRSYSIEDRTTHVAIIRVSQIETKGRALTIHYETIGYAMPAERAASIIQRCLLVDFTRNALASHIDAVCYIDSSSGRRLRLAPP
jgi:hypothetical protein